MLEDKLLIWKFKRGSNEALCEIYQKYGDYLLSLAAALLEDVSISKIFIFIIDVRLQA